MPTAVSPSGRQALLAALLVGLGIVLGGGGSPAPVTEMILQCLAALIVAVWILVSPVRFPFFQADRSAWILAGLILALPIIQLVPLPPVIWQGLPGRELERASLALVGAQDSWRPLSMAPQRTLASLLVLLPAVAVLLMVASLQRGGRALLIAIIAAMALLGLLAGAAQMAGGSEGPFRFYGPDVGWLLGFQANHNSAADVLLIAMVASTALIRDYSELRKHARTASRLTRPYRLSLATGTCLLFAVGVVLTASRAGIFLLPLALMGVLAIVWPWLRFNRRTLVISGLAVTVLLVISGWIIANNAVVERVISRFVFGGEFRPELWRDSLFALQQYFPFGAGIGAFVPVFLAAERLEVVGASFPNRAHNDFLEFGVEAGVFGAMVLAAITAILIRLIVKGWKSPPAGSRAQLVFSITTLALIALHSQVDYPLRSMSLAFIAAACTGLLLPVPGGGEPKGEHD